MTIPISPLQRLHSIEDINIEALLTNKEYIKNIDNTYPPNMAKVISALMGWMDSVEKNPNFIAAQFEGYYDIDTLAIIRQAIFNELSKSGMGEVVKDKLHNEGVDPISGFRFFEIYLTLFVIEEEEKAKEDGDIDIITTLGIPHWECIKNIAQHFQQAPEEDLYKTIKKRAAQILTIIQVENPDLYDVISTLQTLAKQFFALGRAKSGGGGPKNKQQQTADMLAHMNVVKEQVQNIVAVQQVQNQQLAQSTASIQQNTQNTLKK